MFDLSECSKLTVYAQRYDWKGIYDTLPNSASEYEKALAVCADDTFLFSFITKKIKSYLPDNEELPKSVEFSMSEVLKNLEADLELIAERRRKMTSKEATQAGFQAAVERTTEFHAKQMSKEYWILSEMCIRTEMIINEAISPWLNAKAFVNPGAPCHFHIHKPQEMIPKMPTFLIDALKFGHSSRVVANNMFLETVREATLDGESLRSDTLAFARQFRKFLETGKPHNLPLLTMGTIREREVTYNESFNKFNITCPTNCNCGIDEIKAKKQELLQFRSGNDPKAAKEKVQIIKWFEKMDRESPAPVFFRSPCRIPSSSSTGSMTALSNLLSPTVYSPTAFALPKAKPRDLTVLRAIRGVSESAALLSKERTRNSPGQTNLGSGLAAHHCQEGNYSKPYRSQRDNIE